MEDLRQEAKNLLEEIPDDKLLGTIRALNFLLHTTDTFWQNKNQGEPCTPETYFEANIQKKIYGDRKFKRDMRINNILLKIMWFEIGVIIIFDILIAIYGVDAVIAMFK